MADPDAVAVGELPGVDLQIVDGGAVGRVEVGEQRGGAVPADLDVPARDTGVGKTELRVLAASDHVGALVELEGAVAAVLQVEGDRRRRVAAGRASVTLVVAALIVVARRLLAVALLAVALVVAGLLAVALVVAGLLAVALVIALLAVALLVVVTGLLAVALVVAGLLTITCLLYTSPSPRDRG